MVCGILAWKCGPSFAVVTAVTMVAYSWFTVKTTSWRTGFRKEANSADNRGATTSVDSLLNYEAVKASVGLGDKARSNLGKASLHLLIDFSYPLSTLYFS